MQFTLKARLLLVSLGAVFLTVVALVGLSSSSIRDNAMQRTQHEVDQLATTFAGGIGQWMVDRQQAISSLRSTLQRNLDVNITPFLMQAHEASGLALTYYGDEKGNMYRQDPNLQRAGYDPRVRPWYRDAKRAGAMIMTAPYFSATMQKPVVTIAEPLLQNGQIQGVVAADLTIEQLTEAVRTLKVPGEGYAVMLERSGLIISHPDKALNGQRVDQLGGIFTPQWFSAAIRANTVDEMKFAGSDKLFYVAAVPHTDWALMFVMDKASIMAEATELAWWMSGVGALFLVGFGGLLVLVFKSQFSDLERLAKALNDIAEGEGDLTVRIETRNQHDEIGTLASGFNRFVERLHGMISRMNEIAQQLGEQAQQTRDSAEDSRRRIEGQQDEVTMVATAVTEMAGATEEIAGNAEQAALTAQSAVGLSGSSQQQVQQSQESIHCLAQEVATASEIIGELNEHSQKINSILLTISGIAEQTNLLALNAAIEAARAGEQGRGFAVVADEVRVLSQRTHASTQEIQAMIETLQMTATKAVNSMAQSHQMAETSVMDAESASASLEQISQAIAQISDMASQIAAAAEEQTSVTGEINRNTESIREVSLLLSQEANSATTKAQQLAELSDSLRHEVGRFKL